MTHFCFQFIQETISVYLKSEIMTHDNDLFGTVFPYLYKLIYPQSKNISVTITFVIFIITNLP